MKLYKLTDENHMTMNNTEWGVGVSHSGTGIGEMCGPGWIHAYRTPLMAAFFNPIHADFKQPVLWEADGEISKDDVIKVGCRRLTTLRVVPLPEISTEQRVKIAIRCVLAVYEDKSYVVWANNWLSGEDRSARSAREAAADAVARSAEWAWAADAAAARAAWAAAEWASAADAAAADAAAWSARSAWSAAKIDIISIIKEVIGNEPDTL